MNSKYKDIKNIPKTLQIIDGELIAVPTEELRKPREFTLYLDKDGDILLFGSAKGSVEIIKVREIIGGF